MPAGRDRGGIVTRWDDVAGRPSGETYAARFDQLEAQGADIHGEASLCAALVPAPARVLDAGCGTGRVAIRLRELGYDCVGVDVDPSMLDVARARAPRLPWIEQDLAALELPGEEPFDLIVAAGNVVPLLAPGSEPAAVAAFARHLRPGGLLVAGFGLDAAHLPLPEATVTLADYDRWCTAAGLATVQRLATWDGAAYDGGGYAVTISRREPA
jgi:SAM-dependent methyltransferase